jgi:hypothetical protein
MPIYRCPQCGLPASTQRVELCPACRKPKVPHANPTIETGAEYGVVELVGGALLLLVSFGLAGFAVARGVPQMIETALWLFTMGIVPFLTGLIRVTTFARDED